jgi:DNA-binding transcriptional MerR regulator
MPPTTYRMRDLCAMTGLSRQAIHFYIQEGLVPEGTKTGRNMAFYGPEHVERLRIVRRLQEERFLPLKQIRALLDGDADRVGAGQRDLLLEVRAALSTARGEPPPPPPAPDLSRLLANPAWLGDLLCQLRAHGLTLDAEGTVSTFSTLEKHDS